jgi:hypothetical protein
MKKWVLLQKNAWPHTAQVLMLELAGMSGTPAEHPPYNLDLTHCDFWVFPKLTQELQGKKFSSSIQVMHATATTLHKKS